MELHVCCCWLYGGGGYVKLMGVVVWLIMLYMKTGGAKRAKNAVQSRQVESAREIVPQQYAGDATYESQIDTEKDRWAWLFYRDVWLCLQVLEADNVGDCGGDL